MSSLFGNTQSTTKPSLFSTPAASSSPFGGLNNTTQPAQQTGSSLFGTLGTASSQPQQGGLFAPKTTQPQTPGSLFGNSTQAPAQSSLFGSTTTTQPQQSSLFGSTTQAPQQTGTSLFGQTATTTQPQQQPGSSLFGATVSTTQPQQPSLFQSTSQGPNQQNGGQSAAYFDTILERSRKRAHADSTSEDLPALQLGLGDLRQRIKRLGTGTGTSSGTGTPERAHDGKAHYLLAASGVDPGAAIRDLNLLTSQATRTERTQTVEPDDTDVEAYLANLETQTTLSMISDGLARSVKDFDTFLEDKMTMEWDAQRKRIYEHFGIKAKEGLDNTRANASFAASASESQGGFGRSRRGKGAALNGSRAAGTPGASTFGRSAMSKSVIGSAAPIGTASQPLFADIEKKVEANPNAVGPSDRFLREKQGRFIAKVQKLNEARIQKTSYPVLAELSSVVGQTGESYTSEVIKAYRAVIEMVGEDPDVVSLGDPRAVKERQFALAYLDELPGSANSIATKKRILNGSTRFLEKLFFEELEAYVEKNPREANLGGVPNVLSKVKAWIRIKAARKDLTPDNADQLQTVNGDYMWALVFYLLRSGHVKEAVDYVTANAVAFRAIDRNFAAYLAAYYNSPDRRLRRDLQDRMHNEYNQRTRIAPENSLDPFRMCCYKVIGRCDIENRTLNGIIQSMEDYIWLQFVLAREVSKVDETASEVYGLSDVQATIQEIGSKHFTKAGADGSDAFGVYFFLQVLAGLFESAVEYLYALRHIDAVHFAIALDFYGLLRVSDPNVAESDFLSFTTRGSPQVNFGRMIGYYTRDFRSANATAAVDYLSLICLNHDLPGDIGRKQVALCHEALRELVLESREFALLVGDIKADGQRIKGVIEERLPLLRLEDEDDFMRTITIQAASVADDNGRTTDAVLLYQLAGEYNNVTVIITRALSEAVAVPIGHDPVHLQPLKPRAPEEKEASSSSLSLATIDEPVALAKAMIGLWAGKRSYLDKIKQENKAACEVLLRMSDAKTLVEQEQWARAMDIIIALDILPLKVGGNPSEIRSYASKFSSLPQTVANNVPNLLMWTLLCCERQRTHLVNGQFGGNEGTRRLMIEDLRQKNVDLATYTSQLRFRLPGSLHDLLAKAVTE